MSDSLTTRYCCLREQRQQRELCLLLTETTDLLNDVTSIRMRWEVEPLCHDKVGVLVNEAVGGRMTTEQLEISGWRLFPMAKARVQVRQQVEDCSAFKDSPEPDEFPQRLLILEHKPQINPQLSFQKEECCLLPLV